MSQDTPENPHEQWYDENIAPRLLELAHECVARGLPFVAQVEYAPGETSETCWVPHSASIKSQMALWAVRSHGNADALIAAMLRHPAGHESVYLRIIEAAR
jgi:hypothetical protein